MPRATGQGQREFYEKRYNLETFGVEELSERITESVACELSRLLTTEQVQALSQMSQKWLAHHAAIDAQRKR